MGRLSNSFDCLSAITRATECKILLLSFNFRECASPTIYSEYICSPCGTHMHRNLVQGTATDISSIVLPGFDQNFANLERFKAFAISHPAVCHILYTFLQRVFRIFKHSSTIYKIYSNSLALLSELRWYCEYPSPFHDLKHSTYSISLF